jgi:hypothetical protein
LLAAIKEGASEPEALLEKLESFKAALGANGASRSGEAFAAKMILSLGPRQLASLTLHAKTNERRQLAAGYLASFGRPGESQSKAANAAFNAQIKFDVEAQKLPWDGGALYVPSLPWSQTEARELIGQLIRWMVWCSRRNNQAGQTQIANVISGASSLLQVAGASQLANSSSADGCLEQWRTIVGVGETRKILAEQGLTKLPQYQQYVAPEK